MLQLVQRSQRLKRKYQILMVLVKKKNYNKKVTEIKNQILSSTSFVANATFNKKVINI